MKTIACSLGIVLLLLFFAGCASQAPEEAPEETTTTVAETTTSTTASSSTSTSATTTSTSTTTTLATKKCWDSSNGFLYFDIPQMRKFCLCASGRFSYKTYYRAGNYGPAYSYIDTRNTEAWAVRRTPSTYSPLYYVVCGDNRTYWTNQTYYR